MHGILVGGATIRNGRLRLDGKGSFLRTAPLQQEVREKTLEVWLSSLTSRREEALRSRWKTAMARVSMPSYSPSDNPENGSRGVLSCSALRIWRQPRRQPNPEELIHLAVVYREDNSIAVYRNGKCYGKSYSPSGANATLRTYKPQESRVLIGLRHTGSNNGYLAGEIEEARLYSQALNEKEVAESFQQRSSRNLPGRNASGFDPEQRNQRERLLAEARIATRLLKAMPAIPLVYAGTREKPPPTHLLIRGDVEKKEELMTPGGLSAIKLPSPDFGLAPDADEGERRRKFAEWIGSAENPLTARRIGQSHLATAFRHRDRRDAQ